MKYKAILLKNQGKIYFKVKEITFSPDKTTLQIKDKDKEKTIHLSLDLAYIHNNTGYVFYDIDSEKQLSFKEFSHGIDAEDIDTIITKKLLTSLMIKIKQGTEIIDKSHILMYLLMVFAGVAIGTMIGVIIYPIIVPTPIISQPNIPSV